jgi:hypothetical protein|tara:strand:- start:1145 stop:1255 length:111 start_codon:yes stop_codon:yes gene_type:complete
LSKNETVAAKVVNATAQAKPKEQAKNATASVKAEIK